MFATALERAARWRGHSPAFICNDRMLTWCELTERARSLAAGLAALGVQPGDRVVTVLPNGLAAVELFAACAYSNFILVPLNFRWSEAEIAAALDDSAPKVIVFDKIYRDVATAAAVGRDVAIVDLDDGGPVNALRYDALLDHQPVSPRPRSSVEPMAIFYTGGTTGRSKGVMLSSANVHSNALAAMAEGMFGERSTFLHASPMFHIAGALCVHGAFLSGAGNVVLERFEPAKALEAIAENRVQQTLWVPTMIGSILDHPDFSSTDVSSMELIAYGAAPITQTLLQRAMHAFQGTRFLQLYGMTETSPTAAVLHCRDFAGEEKISERASSVGRPITGTEVKIVRPDGQDCDRGEVGEIMTRGPGVMLGYWNMPDETAEAVKDGWMRTGDGGYMDADGYIFLADRLKDMIISGGENVFSIEVENVIASIEGVRQCAVVGLPHPHWGETVHAIVVPVSGVTLSPDQIIQQCRARLAAYKVPKSVEVRVEDLPLSGAGKILKRELRAHSRGSVQ